MPMYRCQTVIRTADNNQANYATNSTYWFTAAPEDLEEVVLLMKSAYDLWRPQMGALAAQNLHECKFYNLADPEPRAPVLESTFNLASAPSGSSLPPEVTLCCSFQGERISGIPQARRRGRIYLPFPSTASSGSDGRPTSGAVTAAAAFGDELLGFSLTPGNPVWNVHSTISEGDAAITNGWVDNEWDTQRRRGRIATSRTVYPEP